MHADAHALWQQHCSSCTALSTFSHRRRSLSCLTGTIHAAHLQEFSVSQVRHKPI